MDQLNNISPTPAPSAQTQEEIAFAEWLTTKSADMLVYFNNFISSRVLAPLQAKIDARDANKNSSLWIYSLSITITAEEAAIFEDCYCSRYRKQQWITDNYNAQFPDSLTRMGGYSIKRTRSDDIPPSELIILKMCFTTPPQ